MDDNDTIPKIVNVFSLAKTKPNLHPTTVPVVSVLSPTCFPAVSKNVVKYHPILCKSRTTQQNFADDANNLKLQSSTRVAVLPVHGSKVIPTVSQHSILFSSGQLQKGNNITTVNTHIVTTTVPNSTPEKFVRILPKTTSQSHGSYSSSFSYTAKNCQQNRNVKLNKKKLNSLSNPFINITDDILRKLVQDVTTKPLLPPQKASSITKHNHNFVTTVPISNGKIQLLNNEATIPVSISTANANTVDVTSSTFRLPTILRHSCTTRKSNVGNLAKDGGPMNIETDLSETNTIVDATAIDLSSSNFKNAAILTPSCSTYKSDSVLLNNEVAMTVTNTTAVISKIDDTSSILRPTIPTPSCTTYKSNVGSLTKDSVSLNSKTIMSVTNTTAVDSSSENLTILTPSCTTFKPNVKAFVEDKVSLNNATAVPVTNTTAAITMIDLTGFSSKNAEILAHSCTTYKSNVQILGNDVTSDVSSLTFKEPTILTPSSTTHKLNVETVVKSSVSEVCVLSQNAHTASNVFPKLLPNTECSIVEGDNTEIVNNQTDVADDNIAEDEAMQIAASLFIDGNLENINDHENLLSPEKLLSPTPTEDKIDNIEIQDSEEKSIKEEDNKEVNEDSDTYTVSSSSEDEEEHESSEESEYKPSDDNSEESDESSEVSDENLPIKRGHTRKKAKIDLNESNTLKITSPFRNSSQIVRCDNTIQSVKICADAKHSRKRIHSFEDKNRIHAKNCASLSSVSSNSITTMHPSGSDLTKTFEKINRLKLLKQQQQEAIEKLRKNKNDLKTTGSKNEMNSSGSKEMKFKVNEKAQDECLPSKTYPLRERKLKTKEFNESSDDVILKENDIVTTNGADVIKPYVISGGADGLLVTKKQDNEKQTPIETDRLPEVKLISPTTMVPPTGYLNKPPFIIALNAKEMKKIAPALKQTVLSTVTSSVARNQYIIQSAESSKSIHKLSSKSSSSITCTQPLYAVCKSFSNTTDSSSIVASTVQASTVALKTNNLIKVATQAGLQGKQIVSPVTANSTIQKQTTPTATAVTNGHLILTSSGQIFLSGPVNQNIQTTQQSFNKVSINNTHPILSSKISSPINPPRLHSPKTGVIPARNIYINNNVKDQSLQNKVANILVNSYQYVLNTASQNNVMVGNTCVPKPVILGNPTKPAQSVVSLGNVVKTIRPKVVQSSPLTKSVKINNLSSLVVPANKILYVDSSPFLIEGKKLVPINDFLVVPYKNKTLDTTKSSGTLPTSSLVQLIHKSESVPISSSTSVNWTQKTPPTTIIQLPPRTQMTVAQLLQNSLSSTVHLTQKCSSTIKTGSQSAVQSPLISPSSNAFLAQKFSTVIQLPPRAQTTGAQLLQKSSSSTTYLTQRSPLTVTQLAQKSPNTHLLSQKSPPITIPHLLQKSYSTVVSPSSNPLFSNTNLAHKSQSPVAQLAQKAQIINFNGQNVLCFVPNETNSLSKASSLSNVPFGPSPRMTVNTPIQNLQPKQTEKVNKTTKPVRKAGSVVLSGKKFQLGMTEKLFRMPDKKHKKWTFLPNMYDHKFPALLGLELCIDDLAGDYFNMKHAAPNIDVADYFKNVLERKKRKGFKTQPRGSRLKKVVKKDLQKRSTNKSDVSTEIVGTSVQEIPLKRKYDSTTRQQTGKRQKTRNNEEAKDSYEDDRALLEIADHNTDVSLVNWTDEDLLRDGSNEPDYPKQVNTESIGKNITKESDKTVSSISKHNNQNDEKETSEHQNTSTSANESFSIISKTQQPSKLLDESIIPLERGHDESDISTDSCDSDVIDPYSLSPSKLNPTVVVKKIDISRLLT
ncbi:mucin-17-like [Hydractinia symbiolongicarpus]|uniref:mucin-17-like n=1 Tax=Hydractinia symbiolongicarpus TaxID=13093 RepID=UPI00254A046F|nr:mucin-17-like [Hydractinia symbiolongicarpus]XP_057295958.1 mucin-17-like [Hydractinia symbiolongicarpus]XP_057295959.1 mucin-17-like [Hydractinia symbiolongicarpus]XP_057295960.1 mucin-17-like [Hydractinia symbiolongicarpus]